MLVATVFAALAFRLFRLTAQYAVNIFFWDQWDFNDASLFGHHTVWGIFRFQHGPHRQGVGGLLEALVEPWFRWNSRTEAFLVTGIVVIAGLSMLLLKYRLFGDLTWTDVTIPMLVFTPAQWESDWNTVNLAHGILPVLLVVLYCLGWAWRNERYKYALITGLNFATLYTGFGFFLGLLTPPLLLAKYREKRGVYLLVCLGLSIVALASFFVNYRNQDASGCPSILAAPLTDYLRYFGLMFASPFGLRGIGWAFIPGLVAMAAVAGVAAVSWKRVLVRASDPYVVLATWSGYSLLFCAATTLGRTCTGLDEAHSSRYAVYKELAILSLYFWALTVRQPKWRRACSWLLPVVLIPSLLVTARDRQDMSDLFNLKRGWRACYLSGKPADECDDANGAIHPDPDRTHLQEKLDYLRATRLNLFSDTKPGTVP
jgi:hypothetical protein